MATYDHFVYLPTRVKLEIVKKCYPIPYVRLRRSCRFLDELCEKNRHRLGIYLYQNSPNLYLLNSLGRLPFSASWNANQKTISKPHIVINYGKCNGIPGFLVPMAKEHIRQIRRSLSGFGFTRLTISSSTEKSIRIKQEFGEALANFLEIAAEFHINDLYISQVSASEAETIVTTWKKINSAYFNCSMHSWDVLQLDCIKNIETICFTFYQWKNQPIICNRTIQEFALGKENVRIFATNLNSSISRLALGNIIKSWKAGKVHQTFCYAFSDPRSYYNKANIYDEWDPLMPTNALYLGNYSQLLRLTQSQKPEKFDIWINERPDDSIFQLFYISRRIHSTEARCVTDFHLFTRKRKDDLVTMLIYVLDFIFDCCPLDYSGLYEEMAKINTLTEKRKTYSRLLDTFYKKVNRRTRSGQPPRRHWRREILYEEIR